MTVKKLIIFLSLTFIISCSSSVSHQYFSEVGYLKTVIANTNDRIISLANGMNLKTDRIIIAVNSTPVLLIIENYTGSGYFYLRNNRVNFTIDPSNADLDMLGINRGRLHFLQDIDKENRTITLVDSTRWFVPIDEHWQQVQKWTTIPELLIPYNQPEKGEYLIHVPTAQSILAIPIDETKS